MHNVEHFRANGFDGAVLPRCVDCGEAVLNSKRRHESLHELVAEVRALIGEPLQNRNEGGEVLIEKIARSFSIRFLARSQEDVTEEVILENQDALMSSARFSYVEKIEVKKLRQVLSMNLLSKRARNL